MPRRHDLFENVPWGLWPFLLLLKNHSQSQMVERHLIQTVHCLSEPFCLHTGSFTVRQNKNVKRKLLSYRPF